MTGTPMRLDAWHDYEQSQDPAILDRLLHDDVVFHSPVVHTPQRGKAITKAYLVAATRVLFSPDFRYVRTFDCGERTVLEFVTEIDGIQINGVDMIEWDADGRITDFKVMVRPLKAIEKLHSLMAEMLQKMANRG
ncbi:MAG: nuclear transport factor 2 family protein [Minwuia sp.]|uniref:nuclear transport factor 2 family protein n=1 Tax=Minwuia sp. TaxID=2493630 RepID=UPI003A891F60